MNSDSNGPSATFWYSVLLAAMLLYPASLGPWVYFGSRFELPAPVMAVAEVIYQPVEVVIDHLPEQIAGWYLMYIYWWMARSGHPIHC